MTDAAHTSETASTASGTRTATSLERYAAGAARFLWHFAVPALAASAMLRHLLPSPAAAAGTGWERIATFASSQRFLGFVLVALCLGAVTRVWSGWLPPARARTATAGRRATEAVLALALAVALGLGVRAVGGTYQVLSASMLPTLEPEDVVAGVRGALLAKDGKGNAHIQRGDIIVFRKPQGTEGPEHVVKRVVGLPGDVITMNGPHVVINGNEAPSCDAGAYFYPLPGGGGVAGRLLVEFFDEKPHLAVVLPYEASWPERYEVKQGELFVLGDNRSNSADSRAWNGGKGAGVPFSAIVSRVTTWVSGIKRDQSLDLDHPLRPLELGVRLNALDAAPLRAGVAQCSASRPAPPTAPAEVHASH